jgi:tetratricopeptide (TPR) repeat protein
MATIRTILGAVGLVLLGGCGHRSSSTGTLTSAQIRTGYREGEAASEAIMLGKYNDALARADRAVMLAPNNAWAHYSRAVALHRLGRPDAAVAAYRDAELRFGDDRWGRSIAIYGRARALDEAGRCGAAQAAYREYAVFMRPVDPRAAEMAFEYANQCKPTAPPPPDTPVLAEMGSALASGEYAQVLAYGDKLAISPTRSPWIDYNLGSAFTGLGRTDEAVSAFRRAEAEFGDDPTNRWGRSVAIWGRARALENAGRCHEAFQAFDEYGALVGASDPAAARLAKTYARNCK